MHKAALSACLESTPVNVPCGAPKAGASRRVLLAEDVLLILLDDRSGKWITINPWRWLPDVTDIFEYGVGGALLVDWH